MCAYKKVFYIENRIKKFGSEKLPDKNLKNTRLLELKHTF